jgi:hypothetical protein
VRSFYSCKNVATLDLQRVDDPAPVLWECGCGCCVYKSCHAVANNIRRWAPDHPTCFHCPAHATLVQRRPYTSKAWEAAVSALVLVGGGAVVWEAHLVPNYRAYDMWLWPYRVAVEIDGAQHFVGRCYTTSAAAKATTDRKKEQAAVGERYHVARLHYKDSRTWCFTLVQALWAAKLGLPAHVHLSPSYNSP